MRRRVPGWLSGRRAEWPAGPLRWEQRGHSTSMGRMPGSRMPGLCWGACACFKDQCSSAANNGALPHPDAASTGRGERSGHLRNIVKAEEWQCSSEIIPCAVYINENERLLGRIILYYQL